MASNLQDKMFHNIFQITSPIRQQGFSISFLRLTLFYREIVYYTKVEGHGFRDSEISKSFFFGGKQ